MWQLQFVLITQPEQLQKLKKNFVHAGGAGVAQRYSAGLGAGWSGFLVPVGAGNFSLHEVVQTGSGTHPASYPMGTRGSFPGGKAAREWSWTLTSPYSAEVKECVELYLHSLTLFVDQNETCCSLGSVVTQRVKKWQSVQKISTV